MNSKSVFHLISYLMFVIGISMFMCSVLSFAFNEETNITISLIVSGSITTLSSLFLWLLTRCKISLTRRDGFGVVTFGWIIITLFGSLPYLLCGVIDHPVSALVTPWGKPTKGAKTRSNKDTDKYIIRSRHLKKKGRR